MKKMIIFIGLLFSLFIVGCNNENEQEKCDGVNHTESEWVITKEATCDSFGERVKKCVYCEEIIQTEQIEKTNHDIVTDKRIEATCVNTGLTEGSHCSKCNEIIVKQELISALGHSYVLNEDKSTSDEYFYECFRCGDSYTMPIGETNPCVDGHKESDWIIIKESTCEDTGSKHKICEMCGIELAVEVILLAEHTESEWIITSESTCTNHGSEHKICLLCGKELEIKELPLSEHIIVIDEEIQPTCTSTGLTEGSHCQICNEIIKAQEVIPVKSHSYVLTTTIPATKETEGYNEYTCEYCHDTYREVIAKLTDYDETKDTIITLSDDKISISNDNGGVIVDNSIITINKAGEYTFSGTLTNGQIIVGIGEEDKITLNLEGIDLTSDFGDPISIISGDKVEISAKSGTINTINDKREFSTDAKGAAIYSEIDMEVKGKGELNLICTYNNGIASKNDLTIKNLTLNVKAPNNAIKGNDSLTIESGKITAISTKGDALKTENSDISQKGNQRGIIEIDDGTLNLYAACDGIDASYDAIINGGTINIYTEANSSYSEDVTVTSNEKMYIRVSSRTSLQTSYKYAGLFTLENNTTTWAQFTYAPSGQTRYFTSVIPESAKYVKFYVYSSTQEVGGTSDYLFVSDQMTIPTSFDTFYINNASTKGISGSWTNYATNQGGRPGGMMDGNQDEALYSCKGIKADNEVFINSGVITILAHDDGIHANSDTLLETNAYGKGNVTISGGDIKITTDDDGIHADGVLSISNGVIDIIKSYEALEGNNIVISGGTTKLKSSDDGLNAKSVLTISGGVLYLDANGDGIDSNGTITMTNGIVLAIGPVNGGNGVIDYDRSFSFSGGLLLAIGCSGMNQKPTATSGNTSTSKTISTNTSSYVVVTSNSEVVAIIKVTKQSQNYCVLAYNNTSYPSSNVSVTNTISNTLIDEKYYVK